MMMRDSRRTPFDGAFPGPMLTLTPGWHPILVLFPLAPINTFAVWRTLLSDGEREVPRC